MAAVWDAELFAPITRALPAGVLRFTLPETIYSHIHTGRTEGVARGGEYYWLGGGRFLGNTSDVLNRGGGDFPVGWSACPDLRGSADATFPGIKLVSQNFALAGGGSIAYIAVASRKDRKKCGEEYSDDVDQDGSVVSKCSRQEKQQFTGNTELVGIIILFTVPAPTSAGSMKALIHLPTTTYVDQ